MLGIFVEPDDVLPLEAPVLAAAAKGVRDGARPLLRSLLNSFASIQTFPFPPFRPVSSASVASLWSLFRPAG